MKATATTPRRSPHKGKLVSAGRVFDRAWIIALLLLFGSVQVESGGVEHPRSIRAEDDCSSCHADKAKGKSVHSAMVLRCICHVARTQGDMTTLSLLMPRPKTCSACHEQPSSEHRAVANGSCLDCHDAHSGVRRSLLRQPTRSGSVAHK